MYDFDDAEEQKTWNVIPNSTLVKVKLNIKDGEFGEGNIISQSDSGFEYFLLEAKVLTGPFAGRKVWQNIGVGGTTEGHRKAVQIARSLLRGILESSRDVLTKDDSPEARKKRRIDSYAELIGMVFVAELGIKNGNNFIKRAITPEHPKYREKMAEKSPEDDFFSQEVPSVGPDELIPDWAK